VILGRKWPKTTPCNGRMNREKVERRVTANREKVYITSNLFNQFFVYDVIILGSHKFGLEDF
jgi:hypothetical protein